MLLDTAALPAGGRSAISFLTSLLMQTEVVLSTSRLRWEILSFAAGVISVSLALAAAALFFWRRRGRDPTLIFLALFSGLYGIRLLASLQIIESNFSFSPLFWRYVDWAVTSTIVIPLGFFLYQVIGPRSKPFIRWLITIQVIFTVIAIFATFAGADLSKLYLANNTLVLGILAAAAIHRLILWLRGGPRQTATREIRVFTIGFVIWLLFIVQANLTGMKVVRTYNYEFVGFLVFVCCLGYVTASRSFAQEEALLNINKELEIARQIQSSILPREIPRLAGLEIAARYVPMSAVAGDFYDFLVVDAQRVGILVADVSGHGVPAALIASMLKVAFGEQVANADDPARVLTGLNRALCGKFEEYFVTAAYVFVDAAKGLMRYAGAGHPPLLVVAGDGSGVRMVEENGLMLGIFPDAEYTGAEIRLRGGDRCVIYTDGLFEASNAALEEFGKPRLAEFLERHRELSTARIADALLEEVSRWSGGESGHRQDDDITLVVADFRPPQTA
jgi:hypothetical protein